MIGGLSVPPPPQGAWYGPPPCETVGCGGSLVVLDRVSVRPFVAFGVPLVFLRFDSPFLWFS